MFTATRDSEAKLIETLASIRDEANSWRAVFFQFAKLLEGYRNDYQIKIAVNLINDLLKIYQGGIFVCADSSIYVLCRNVTKAQLDKVIFQLRYLFMDDPLAYNADGQENSEFCRVYDLNHEWDRFYEQCKKRFGRGAADLQPRTKPPEAPNVSPKAERAALVANAAAKATAKASPNARNKPEPAAEKSPLPLGDLPNRSDGATKFNPKALASIEQDLRTADLSRVMRRQPICAALPGMPVRRVFDETYINIAHLRKILHSDADLLSNRWLFKYLTQILDERVLDMLRYNPRYMDTPLSLNFNVDTLLSSAFNAFDTGLKPASKVSIVLELQVADVFGDMQGFMLAKETVQKLGYRVCLDGLTNLSFLHIDRERLGFDLVKLQWNPDMDVDVQTLENIHLQDAIRRCGANRVILCRCDSKAAIEFGQSIGISLFQGRYIDTLVNPASRTEN